MTVDGYNRFCRSLPATSHVVQWGGAHVWKVGGKVFAIAWFDSDEPDAEDELLVTFKVSELSFEMLKELPGCRPAPYLASRGMKWIQRTGPQSMDDAALRDYLAESHRIVASGLSKRKQQLLRLNVTAPAKRAVSETTANRKPNSARPRAPTAPVKAATKSNPRNLRTPRGENV